MINKSSWLFSLSKGGSIHYTTAYSKRFTGDKVEYEDENLVILADGIVLNKDEIIGSGNDHASLKDYYFDCLEDNSLIKKLIGPFVAVVYDKRRKEGIAFGNQTGDASVFYGYNQQKNTLFLSNNFNEVFKISCLDCINEKAAHYLLTYGFIVDDSTIVDGIYRIQAGKVLKFTPKETHIAQYHRFNFHDKIDICLDDAVERVDLLFRKAVKRCFDKDLEYGYTQHLVDLSAGLDSRMTNVVAKELGYKNIVNISYSQSGSDEQKIAQNVALKLENQFYHKSLGDASFFYEIEDTVLEEFGMAHYDGITGGRQFLRMIDFNKFGLEHTGQIGDVVISQFFRRTTSSYDINDKRNSDLLHIRYPIEDVFCSNEEFAFYTRAFQGALSTHYIRSNYTYTVSPFLDPELIAFCASLPDVIRSSHRLYWNWIDKKYPEFGKIPSTRLRHYSGMGLQRFLVFVKTKLKLKAQRRMYKFLHDIGASKLGATSNNMNPYQYWYETNKQLRHFVENFYLNHRHLVESMETVKAEVDQMYRSSNVFDKFMAISLLETIKVYTDKNDN